jgi:hypothetical protein
VWCEDREIVGQRYLHNGVKFLPSHGRVIESLQVHDKYLRETVHTEILGEIIHTFALGALVAALIHSLRIYIGFNTST